MVTAFGVFDSNIDTYTFSSVWPHVITEISVHLSQFYYFSILTFLCQAIYPTVIIIFVSTVISYDNAAIYPTIKHSVGSPLGDAQSNRVERDRDGILSIFRFNMPQ